MSNKVCRREYVYVIRSPWALLNEQMQLKVYQVVNQMPTLMLACTRCALVTMENRHLDKDGKYDSKVFIKQSFLLMLILTF